MKWMCRFFSFNHPLFNQFQVHYHTRSTLSLRNLGACISLLQSCALYRDLSKGKEVHSWMVVHGFQTSPLSITSLINLYSKCACPREALSIFHGAKGLSLFSWNAVISGMMSNGLPTDALALYHEMRNLGIVPDIFTYPCVINAYSNLQETNEIKKIHGCLFKVGLELDIFICSALVTSYIKSNHMKEAKNIFEELPKRDVVLWNSMVNGFAQIGRFQDALEFFQRMTNDGMFPSKFTVTGIISVFTATGAIVDGRKVHAFTKKCGYELDVTISNSLIDMYGKIGHVEEALQIFESMSRKDIFSWNSMLSVLQKDGDHMGTLKLLCEMKKDGVPPDSITLTAALPACAHTAALMHGRGIHGHIVVNCLRSDGNIFIENAIMDMYSKCGNLDDAQSVFDRIQTRDVSSWNILIGGYAAYGQGAKALQLFARMCESGIAPDEVTFVELLSACSHAGLLERGKEIIEKMERDYKVIPTDRHYSCLVDMLARAGKLSEAQDVLLNMPAGSRSNPVVWRAFLAACCTHGDMELAVNAANHLLEVEPEHCGSYVLLSNIYGSEGKYEEVSEVRSSMRNLNVRKIPGCSWIELASGMHAFITRDKNHEESEKIYSMLDMLVISLRDSGYVPDVQQGL